VISDAAHADWSYICIKNKPYQGADQYTHTLYVFR
jgi:hypothetical protein